MAGPWEQYAAPRASAPPADGPWTQYAGQAVEASAAASPGMETAKGLAKQAGVGLLKGVIGLPGMAGDIYKMGEFGAEEAFRHTVGRVDNLIRKGTFDPLTREEMAEVNAESRRRIGATPGDLADVIGSDDFIRGAESVVGEFRKPQTRAERFVDTAASFVPSALGGGGSLAKRAVGQGVVPGVASEAAGQAVEGSEYEWLARLAGALGGSVASAAATRSGAPRQMTAEALQGVTVGELQRANNLMQNSLASGIRLSWPEAIEQVTKGGSGMTNLQRVVEGSERGGPMMRQFYKDRPADIETAVRSELGGIEPSPVPPEQLGPRAGKIAGESIEHVRKDINTATRPLYQQAGPVQVDPAVAGTIVNNPIYQEAVKKIRKDKVLGPQFANVPNDSIAMIDAAQKIMRDMGESARTPGPSLNNYKAALIDEARGNITDIAKQASPEYRTAVEQQALLREQHLTPVQKGPLGTVAKSTKVSEQTKALFPDSPAPGSERMTADTIARIRNASPEVASSLVRSHAEQVFNETTQKLIGGANQMGGAKFSAVLTGNPQQKANLRAAVLALPQGAVRWNGFNRFLEVLEATGKRQHIGSHTSFNDRMFKSLEVGSMPGEIAAAIGSPTKALGFVSDAYARFRLGKGTEDLARLFTDPGAIKELRILATRGPHTPQAIAATARLAARFTLAREAAAPDE